MRGGLREIVISLKFRQNRMNRFRDVGGGRNLPFPILKASGLYNSLYYRTSRDWWATYRDANYLCDKFGDFSFSCFGFIVRTELQTESQRRIIAIIHVTIKYI